MKNMIRLPAEWEKHRATWLAWASNVDNWYGKMETVAWAFIEIARHLANAEKVCLTVNTPTEREIVMQKLRAGNVNLSNIEIYQFPTFWGWMRDCGPQFIKRDEQIEIVDFKFNAWANYDNWESDDKIPQRIAEQFNLPRTIAMFNHQRWVLEGGAIDSNGAGTMLTTEECLLDKNIQVRNPQTTRDDNEKVFAQYLGIEKTLWLPQGLNGDDTHGHVDDVARFVNKNTVVAVGEKNSADENYHATAKNLEFLSSARLANGEKINVITLPMPQPVYYEGERMPASYANFYIGNNTVIVPTFNDVSDYVALGILREFFTDREVVGIHARDLIDGGGSLHCLTMQEPR